MPEVLYNSEAIKQKINELFENPGQADRRVALVAYVSRQYADYLPNPRDMEVICSPTPGVTSVAAVDGLIRAGAQVRFSDKLHMKVYWSELRGCVITSANLSANALGVRGLKEAGVWMEPNSVDINRLLQQAQPMAVTNSRIKRLRRDEERYRRAMARIGRREADDSFNYIDWYNLSPAARTPWKLADYKSNEGLSSAARTHARNAFNVKEEPADWYGWEDYENFYCEGDWLLSFEYDDENKRVIGSPAWMFADFVINPRRNRFQAVQVYLARNYERPPFPLTAQFNGAFRRYVSEFQDDACVPNTVFPSGQLLRAIADELNGGAG